MGYTVVADRSETDQMRTKYSPRDGLEGPFNFSGRVLYYDVKQGQYYDPRSDFYVEQAEMDMINTSFMERFKTI
jgi:hypothetical protein